MVAWPQVSHGRNVVAISEPCHTSPGLKCSAEMRAPVCFCFDPGKQMRRDLHVRLLTPFPGNHRIITTYNNFLPYLLESVDNTTLDNALKCGSSPGESGTG